MMFRLESIQLSSHQSEHAVAKHPISVYLYPAVPGLLALQNVRDAAIVCEWYQTLLFSNYVSPVPLSVPKLNDVIPGP